MMRGRIGLRLALLLASLLMAVLLVAACEDDEGDEDAAPASTAPAAATAPASTAPAASGGGTQTNIENFTFQTPLRVQGGTAVTWTNRDGVEHTVTARRGAFDSKGIGPTRQFSHTFAAAGQFEYFCSIHNTMTGVVEVQ